MMGYWVSTKIESLLGKRGLNLMDITLLAIISNLNNDTPCFASNPYLAERMDTTTRNIRRSISKLKKLGLIRQSDFNGKYRFLEVRPSIQNDREDESVRSEQSRADENVLPVDENVLPVDENVLPVDENVLSGADENVLPVDENVLPVDENVLPREDESVRVERTNLSGQRGRICPPPMIEKEKIKKKKKTQYRVREGNNFSDLEKPQSSKNDQDKKNKSKPKCPVDLEVLAQKLMKKVQKEKKGNGTDPSKWIGGFRRLLQTDGIKLERVKKVLDWYLANFGGKYIPQAFSAAAFRYKFMQIESAMNRDSHDNEVKEEKIIEKMDISPMGRRIVDRISHGIWPRGSRRQLPGVVQASLDEYHGFLDRRNTLLRSMPSETDSKGITRGIKLKRLLKFLVETMPAPSAFVETWMREVHDNIVNWDSWSGNLGSMGVKIQGKRFQNMGRDWTQSYFGEEVQWDKLMEKMNGPT